MAAAALADGVLRLLRYEPALLAGDEAGVHKARVATRRLRSDLRTFRRVFDEEALRPVRTELRWLGGALGATRDADVLERRLGPALDRVDVTDEAAAGELRRRLHDDRAAAGSRLRDALAGERYPAAVALLLHVARQPPLTPRAAEPAGKATGAVLKRAWQPLADAVEAAGDEAGDEALHAIRIDAKRARYAAEAAASVAGKRARRMAKALARLQGVLGDLRDAAGAEAWLRDAAAASPAQAFLAGRLAEQQASERDAARRGWRLAWDAAVDERRRCRF